MASSSWSLEIAGKGSKPAFFGRYLPQRPCRYLQINMPLRRRLIAAAAVAKSVSPEKFESLAAFPARGRDKHDRITPQKLDEWMQQSVGEIVRNIEKAPFLVRVFSGESEAKKLCSSSDGLTIEKEAATAENWLGIKKRWEEESSVPDGVILVEELDAEEEEEEEEEGKSNVKWGVLIQGQGMDCSACYILNTCRVRSSMGFCTHFCLVRAKCFGDTVGVQLKNAWLVEDGRR